MYTEHFAERVCKRSEKQGEFKLDDFKKSFNFTLHILYLKNVLINTRTRTNTHTHMHVRVCVVVVVVQISVHSLCVDCPTLEEMHIRSGECRVLRCLNLVPLKCLKREENKRYFRIVKKTEKALANTEGGNAATEGKWLVIFNGLLQRTIK